MDKLSELLRDMRAHRTDHGRQTSGTVQAWADRLESALSENLVLRRELVDRELLNWLERKGESLAREHTRQRMLTNATQVLSTLDAPTNRTCPKCSGEGYLIRSRFFGLWPAQEMCDKCYGMGYS